MSDETRSLSLTERTELLRFARHVANRALGGYRAEQPRPSFTGRLGGLFVTLWNGRQLRGCVGRIGPTTDIVGAVEEITLSSLRDPRFADRFISSAELARLTIEISLLTDPVPAAKPLSLTPGLDGIIVRVGHRSGCFLPKVASDRGWSAEQFLDNCCTMKAGLPAKAWQRPDAEVSLFRAEVLSEITTDYSG